MFACSNSESVTPIDLGMSCLEANAKNEFQMDESLHLQEPKDCAVSNEQEYISLDDSEYPYSGLPRIVVETKNNATIKDMVNEVPARLQVWGKDSPESPIISLKIRGRGNSTWWHMPKKSYKIEFDEKKTFLGMPKNRDWALISNYADKTLMKNFLMYRLSAQLGAYYAPRCEFAELFVNGEYQGLYLLTETIKIGKNRVNIPKDSNSYIVEIDGRIRENEPYVYSDVIAANGQYFHIHDPKNPSKHQLKKMENNIHSFEKFLINIQDKADNNVDQWIDVAEYVKHYWVQDFSKNPDARFYTSVYFSWTNDVIKMGPVWDFDLSFGENLSDDCNLSSKWYVRKFYWNRYLFMDSVLSSAVKNFWLEKRDDFNKVLDSIDSVAILLSPAAENNFKKWNILNSTEQWYHPNAYDSYDDAVRHLKSWIQDRIAWIDKQYQNF